MERYIVEQWIEELNTIFINKRRVIMEQWIEELNTIENDLIKLQIEADKEYEDIGDLIELIFRPIRKARLAMKRKS